MTDRLSGRAIDTGIAVTEHGPQDPSVSKVVLGTLRQLQGRDRRDATVSNNCSALSPMQVTRPVQ